MSVIIIHALRKFAFVKNIILNDIQRWRNTQEAEEAPLLRV